MIRHLLEPFDFSLEETERLLTVASHIQQDPTLYQDVAKDVFEGYDPETHELLGTRVWSVTLIAS